MEINILFQEKKNEFIYEMRSVVSLRYIVSLDGSLKIIMRNIIDVVKVVKIIKLFSIHYSAAV